MPSLPHGRTHVAAPAALAAALAALAALPAAPARGEVTGRVVDPAGRPLQGVRVGAFDASGPREATEERAVTGADGTFALDLPRGARQPALTFGRAEYVAGAAEARDGDRDLVLAMEPLPVPDNPTRAWVPPRTGMAQRACQDCHGGQFADWVGSRHAGSARNPWVLDVYRGTARGGEKEGVEPGFRLDRPDDPGECAGCHAPTLVVETGGPAALTEARGVHAEGVFCEACHLVRDVRPGEAPGAAGALRLWRPPVSWGLFAFGPYDDVIGMPMRNVYSPLHRGARLCAGCHEYRNAAGVPVMTTYSEWSELAGSGGEGAIVCQDCHMKPIDGTGPEGDGHIVSNQHERMMHALQRDLATTFPHAMAGTTPDYLSRALALRVTAAATPAGPPEAGAGFPGAPTSPATVTVTVEVGNAGAGHAVPTGMPWRNVMLRVEATGAEGEALSATGGPVLPAWAGDGEGDRHWAGLPGRGFKLVLGDDDGDIDVPFWRATRVVEDTRVPPTHVVRSRFTFAAPRPGPVRARAWLVYRRVPIAMAEAKEWELQDVTMAEAEADVDVEAGEAPPAAQAGRRSACGCRVAAAPTPAAGGAVLVAALCAVAAIARRRRRARRGARERSAGRSPRAP